MMTGLMKTPYRKDEKSSEFLIIGFEMEHLIVGGYGKFTRPLLLKLKARLGSSPACE